MLSFPQLPTQLPADQRRLLRRFASLAAQDRETLLAFADFLAQRGGQAGEGADDVASPAPPEPLYFERPEGETVVAAIKRLTKTYPMLDRALVLHETSALMSEHILQGRPAVEVIDELEGLFVRRYERHREG